MRQLKRTAAAVKENPRQAANLAFHSTLLLAAVTLLGTDVLRVLITAQDKLDDTGDALRGFGSPMSGAHNEFVSICSNLTQPGSYAHVDLTDKQLTINTGNASSIPEIFSNPHIQSSAGLIFKHYWFAAAACLKDNPNSLLLLANAFFGHNQKATVDAAENGFLVFKSQANIDVPFIDPKIVSKMIQGAEATGIAEVLKDGGPNLAQRGQYTNGFEYSFTSTLQNYVCTLAIACLFIAYKSLEHIASATTSLFFPNKPNRVEEIDITPDNNNLITPLATAEP